MYDAALIKDHRIINVAVVGDAGPPEAWADEYDEIVDVRTLPSGHPDHAHPWIDWTRAEAGAVFMPVEPAPPIDQPDYFSL